MEKILFIYFKSGTQQVKVHKDGKEVWNFQDFREAWTIYDFMKNIEIEVEWKTI